MVGETRGEAEREIQSAAKDSAKHIAQRRRRRAPRWSLRGPPTEKFVTRFPYFTVPPTRPRRLQACSWTISRPVIPWIGSSVAMSASARPRSPCARLRPSRCPETGRHRGSDNRSGQAARRDLPQTVRSARHRSRKPVAVDVGCGSERDKGGAAPREIEGRGRHAGPCFEGREIRRPWARHHR